jgi:hypothetical protein
MKSKSASRSKRAGVIDISAEMESYFGLVRIGRELAIQGLMHDGLTKARAEREWARLERASFARREDPPFSRRFPKARIWG